jgi:hypothetical protein
VADNPCRLDAALQRLLVHPDLGGIVAHGHAATELMQPDFERSQFALRVVENERAVWLAGIAPPALRTVRSPRQTAIAGKTAGGEESRMEWAQHRLPGESWRWQP